MVSLVFLLRLGRFWRLVNDSQVRSFPKHRREQVPAMMRWHSRPGLLDSNLGFIHAVNREFFTPVEDSTGLERDG